MTTNFQAVVNTWVRDAISELKEVKDQVILETFHRIVLRTPVLTGRLRESWQVSLNGFPSETLREGQIGSVSVSFSANVSKIKSSRLSDEISIFNSQPYAQRIEFGYSSKAPQGMVRITLAEIDEIVQQAILFS